MHVLNQFDFDINLPHGQKIRESLSMMFTQPVQGFIPARSRGHHNKTALMI